MPDSPTGFPHPAYRAIVLDPALENARERLFAPMLAANTAHVVMLAEQGIVPNEQAAALLRAITQVEEEGVERVVAAAPPTAEDLFFMVEGRLIAQAGADVGGNLQLARSRNDLGAALWRLVARELILDVAGKMLTFRQSLLALATQHIETIMPGYTHTQPAQPTTLAHHLAGVWGPLERDTARLRAAYTRVNQSPLGAAAFTTTAFPIDRDRIAALLGFDGVIENGYDAVGASDAMLEAVGALVICASSLSRFLYDLLVWARIEVGFIRVDDAFVQISSIMPQKRNPVVLEHLRAHLAYIYGDAAAVQTMTHNAAFADTNDVEDDIQIPLYRAFEHAENVLTLFAAVLDTLHVNRERMASLAGRGFTTATELADTLARDFHLPFRTAHGITARVVQAALAADKEADAVTAADVRDAAAIVGRPLPITEEMVRRALDPVAVVAARSLPGGPAPERMRTTIAGSRERLESDRAWLANARHNLAETATARERAANLIATT
ncbi:MAG: argininosuccinate lyase [Chloroflexota bacterium]|nr:argininosuccinate lyase [Chloroflexota bacterium]